MLPIEWRWWAIFAVPSLIAATAIFGLAHAGKLKPRFLRWGTRILCVPLVLAGSLLALLFIAGQGCDSHSALIYSPSRKLAARVDLFDGGALGGETSVEVFWAHGLANSTVFFGEWKTVVPEDIRWASDSDLEITYDGSFDSCSSTASVKVTCTPKQH